MTYRELYKYICRQYDIFHIENGDFESKELILYYFGISKTDLLLNFDNKCDENIVKKITCDIDRRVNNYPLQYIIGEWTFYSNDFCVGDGVLIPRPETEEIVYRTNLFLKNKKNKIVFDLCSGSGCIGISVAKANPDCFVFLFEISDIAIEYIKKNILKNNVNNVKIIKYNIFDGFNCRILPIPDVIVSNPPYIKSEEMDDLQSEVRFEPKLALDGGADGFDFYRCLCKDWIYCIKNDGMFMFETGEGQCSYIKNIIDKKDKVSILKDIYSVERFIYCEL